MNGILSILIGWAAFQAIPDDGARDQRVKRLVEEIDRSGQVLMIAENADERAEPPPLLAPGDPPLLAFRYFEGQSKHRFGQLDLVMDDAGH